MEPADSIGRIGFRKWYERQLIEGHVWLVSCFLCMLAVAAVLEELSFRGSLARQLAFGTFAFAAGTVGVYALLRYLRLMGEALRLGEHATCSACGTYGRFAMISAHAVRCRKCAHEWRLID